MEVGLALFAVIGAVLSIVGWATHSARARLAMLGLLVVTMIACGYLATVLHGESVGSDAYRFLIVGTLGWVGVVGGAHITGGLFAIVDWRPDLDWDRSVVPGQVIRGGTWIGVLERLAVFGGLVGGAPEVVAVVLAVKMFGREAELKAAVEGNNVAVGERFIIGTYASVIWAAGWGVIASAVL